MLVEAVQEDIGQVGQSQVHSHSPLPHTRLNVDLALQQLKQLSDRNSPRLTVLKHFSCDAQSFVDLPPRLELVLLILVETIELDVRLDSVEVQQP